MRSYTSGSPCQYRREDYSIAALRAERPVEPGEIRSAADIEDRLARIYLGLVWRLRCARDNEMQICHSLVLVRRQAQEILARDMAPTPRGEIELPFARPIAELMKIGGESRVLGMMYCASAAATRDKALARSAARVRRRAGKAVAR